MRISELVERVEVPPTHVADGAWEAGKRRVRRRRTAGALAGAAVAAAVVVGVVRVTSPVDIQPMPAPVDTPSVDPDLPGPITADVTMPSLADSSALEELVDVSAVVGTPLSEPATPLSEDPVDHAVYVAAPTPTLIQVLGPDARYRTVDVPGLVPARDGTGDPAPALTATSLDPTGTRLALPQPDALVVVDLTTGEHRTYDVPGESNLHVTWMSQELVLVSEELASTGTAVALADGELLQSRLTGPSTAFPELGVTLDWGPDQRTGPSASEMWWGDGTAVATSATNDGGSSPTVPLVTDEVVVGLHADQSAEAGAIGSGPVVVDRETGRPLAFQPTGTAQGDPTQLLGWDDDRVVLGLLTPWGTQVAAWDWRAGEIEPLVLVGEGTPDVPVVAWGHGWAEVEAAT